MKNLLLASLLLVTANVQALEIHEWGTFTSLVNENGKLMQGMHHEEEGLPGFVYGLREDQPNGKKTVSQLRSLTSCGTRPRPGATKCAFFTGELEDVLPFNQFNTPVTQKMETPVIYFYGNKGEKVNVEVGFPQGMISQWYPAAKSFNPHQNEFKSGHMSWEVTLLNQMDALSFIETNPQSIWNPARKTKANPIQTNINGEETERFIFYRGLGEFDVPLKIKIEETKITLRNSSRETIPAIFYIQSSKEKGILKSIKLGSINGQASLSADTNRAMEGQDVFTELKNSLVSAGLFEDEAIGMIKTWEKSYFHTEGERLLYILPREWTEEILPMKVSPRPSKLSRVLVGRIELFGKLAQKRLIPQDHLYEAKMNALKK